MPGSVEKNLFTIKSLSINLRASSQNESPLDTYITSWDREIKSKTKTMDSDNNSS